MRDDDYGYLTGRMVTERNCARTAICPEAVKAHGDLADAYLTRLQLLIVSPDLSRADEYSTLGERVVAFPTGAELTTAQNRRVGNTFKGPST